MAPPGVGARAGRRRSGARPSLGDDRARRTGASQRFSRLAGRSLYRDPMELGHVVYKVKDLQTGVEEFRARGFAVEYGRARNPINALVYFSSGPYLELLVRTGAPRVLKRLSALVGRQLR